MGYRAGHVSWTTGPEAASEISTTGLTEFQRHFGGRLIIRRTNCGGVAIDADRSLPQFDLDRVRLDGIMQTGEGILRFFQPTQQRH